MLYAPRGEVHIKYAAGLGVVFNHVNLQYKRNAFDVITPRSNISSSESRFLDSCQGGWLCQLALPAAAAAH